MVQGRCDSTAIDLSVVTEMGLPSNLLDWGRGRLRDLPWRRIRDPWSILVAEVMLQQTQVLRVVDRWPKFIEKFPNPTACASTTPAAVISEWSGLGYNRRALNLHRTAKLVVDKHAGEVPDVLADLLALPGIGPYTARAVLAFAFESDVAVVDTNVARVLARWVGRSLTVQEVQSLADVSVPVGEGWAWNQVVLDLGAIMCRSRSPSCWSCPLATRCVWHGEGVDPAVGSARVAGRQAAFAGSDRQGSGRLVSALTAGPVEIRDLAAVMGWPDDQARAERVVGDLISGGLVVVDESRCMLPES